MKVYKVVLWIIIFQVSAICQTVSLNGVVKNQNNEPLADANVYLVKDKDTLYTSFTDTDGFFEINVTATSTEENYYNIPEGYILYQNYPNPFNPSTRIMFEIPSAGNVKLNIFNVLGQKILTLVDRYYLSGIHSVDWFGNDRFGKSVSAGVYIYQINVNEVSITKKMVLLDGGANYSSSMNYSNRNRRSINKKEIKSLNKRTVEIMFDEFIVEKEDYHSYLFENYKISFDENHNEHIIELVHVDSLQLSILELDHVWGGLGNVNIIHDTYVINTTEKRIKFDVESPTDQSFRRDAVRFGLDNRLGSFTEGYYQMPNPNNVYYVNGPDTSTEKAHYFNNLELEPKDGLHINHSNYYGEEEQFYGDSLGICRFYDLEVKSDYFIKKNEVDTTLLDICFDVKYINLSNYPYFDLSLIVYIPKNLTSTSEWNLLYEIISDTLVSEDQVYKFSRVGRADGFGVPTSDGTDIWMETDTLVSKDSLSFKYHITIKPLLDKFEIYPLLVPNGLTKQDNIWPESIIKMGNIKICSEVNYIKAFVKAQPSNILIYYDHGKFGVTSPKNYKPTYGPR